LSREPELGSISGMVDRGALSPLFTDVRISADEATTIAAALRDIADVDGTHPEELELIDSLLADIGADLGEAPELPRITPREIASRLVDPTLRTVMLQCALLLAMADGVISPAERKRIVEYATALGVTGPAYAELERVIESWVRSGDVASLFA
jgi:tellurite resistance protein